MDLYLDLYDPFGTVKPHAKQAEFLSLDRYGPKTSRNHFVGGRGSAKTTSLILLAFRAAYEWMPGMLGCWTEPTSQACEDIFIAEWTKAIPRRLYEIKGGLNTTEIRCCNGTKILVRSRNVDNPRKEVIKGTNLAWDIDDELAYKFDKNKYWDTDAAIRIDTPYRFHDAGTTPKLNEYYHLIHTDEGDLKENIGYVHSTSHENPHLTEDWVDDLKENLDDKYKQQEIDGKWISLGNLVWDNWSDEAWPTGNIINYRHNHDKPYYLFFDIGVASSAWLVVQPIKVPRQTLADGYYGYKAMDTIWVATGEFMPTTEQGGQVDRILPLIIDRFGDGCGGIVCGHDIDTRDSTRGDTVAMLVQQHLGSVPQRIVGRPGDWWSDKILQHSSLSGGILDTQGRRRFCVAKDFYQENPKTKRGILDMMRQDQWPREDDGKAAHRLKKDGKLEHVRDAAMYGAVSMMFPPSGGKRKVHAQ